MTDDEIKRYEEIIRHAVAKCDEWFISNPVYFQDKARLIKERCEAYDKELVRLNPNYRGHESGTCYPEPTNFIDPIHACVGKPVTKWNSIKHYNENTIKILIPSNKDDALLVYVAALLILHDGAAINGEGLKIITENIWPRKNSPMLWASKFFDPHNFSYDRSVFIETSLMHVEADLANLEPAETEQKPTPGKVRRIWIWLKTHPHSYGLTGSVIFLILFLILGLLKTQWRNWCWGTAGIAFLVLILSLLGGKTSK